MTEIKTLSIKSVISRNSKEIKLNFRMSFVNKAIFITQILNNSQNSGSGKAAEMYNVYFLVNYLC